MPLKEAVEKRRTHVVMDERVEKAQEEAGNLFKIAEKVKSLKGEKSSMIRANFDITSAQGLYPQIMSPNALSSQNQLFLSNRPD